MARPQIKMGALMHDYHQVRADETTCLSPYATICGDVVIGRNSSVFSGTQIRGDCEPIRIGECTNIQENSCLHVSTGSPLTVGSRVTVGHMAMLHGCTIEDDVLVGMGSTIMDDAHVGHHSLVAAGSLVTQGKRFPPRSLIMGRPARVERELSDDEIEAMIIVAAPAYRGVAQAMLTNGLMEHPGEGISVWPPR